MTRDQLLKIIDKAIGEEIASYEFYKDASEKIEDQNLKSLFSELSQDELKHKQYLEEFAKSGATTIKIDGSEDYKLSEELDEVELSTDMSFKDAVQLAMKREEAAMNQYKDIAASCEDEEEKKTFEGLSEMEQLHKTRLEDIFLNVGFREVW